jgi:hypothetical protein
MPSAKKFLQRRFSFTVSSSSSSSAASVSDVSGTAKSRYAESESSSSGLLSYSAFCRLRASNASVSQMRIAFFGSSRRLTLSAAGFIATSTSGWSPGVQISVAEKFTWKPETPGSVPAGARISAG